MEATMAAPLYSGERAAGLVAGGGNFRFLFEVFLKNNGLYDLIPGKAMVGFKLLAGHIMSSADPASFAVHLVNEPLPGYSPCPFLLLLALHDGTVPPECGRALAVAARSPLVEPVLEEWDWLEPVAGEHTTYGAIQFDGGHEFFNGGDGSQLQALSQGVMLDYLETYFQSGEPQVVWPQP